MLDWKTDSDASHKQFPESFLHCNNNVPAHLTVRVDIRMAYATLGSLDSLQSFLSLQKYYLKISQISKAEALQGLHPLDYLSLSVKKKKKTTG